MDGIGSAPLLRRFSELGPRILADKRDNYRAVVGFKAQIAPSWDLEGFYSYARNDTTTRLDNAASLSRVRQGLLFDPATGACLDPSNGCVPVNIFGEGNISPAAQDFIRTSGLENRFSSAQHNAALVATGDVFSWSEGTIAASGGVEFRRNIASSLADPALATGDALGFNAFAGAAGDINIVEAFGELLIPLLEAKPLAESLELEFGGRFSHYSTAGNAWTWKAGGQWRPFEALRFKGMWQRAVRAPSVDDLFLVEVASDDGVFFARDDFCAAAADPVGAGLAAVCIAQGMDLSAVGVYDPPAGSPLFFISIAGGNRDLRPERAGTITAGFDYTLDAPFTLLIGADYFSIAIEDAIALEFDAFGACRILADPASDICLAIRRDPDGSPSAVSRKPLNLAGARSKGVDFTLDFSADLPESVGFGADARASLRTAATYYIDLGRQQTANSPFIDCAGSFHGLCASSLGSDFGAATAFPRTLATTSLALESCFVARSFRKPVSTFRERALEKPRWSGSLRWRFVGGVDHLGPVLASLVGDPPPPLAILHVGARHYLDLSGRYEVLDGVALSAGVENILKTDPPLLGDQASQANTDPSRYDVYGRRFYVAVNMRFGG